jgi:hypothetical protein
MKQNVGGADRLVRLMVAAVFAYLYFSATVTGIVGLVLVILAGVFFLTSLIGYCPLYSIFGINTCPSKRQG